MTGSNKINEMINEIYNGSEIPKDLNKSIFIELSKKPAANDCELH